MLLGDKGRENPWRSIPGAGTNERSDGQSFGEMRARRFQETECSLPSVCEKMEGKDGECDVTSCPGWEERDYSQMFTQISASPQRRWTRFKKINSFDP